MSYFATRPDIVKVFDDLDNYRDFCRFELCKFDEKDLYNSASPEWRNFLNSAKRNKPAGGYKGKRFNPNFKRSHTRSN